MNEILKWIAYERLGSFCLLNGRVQFRPGIHLKNLYYPVTATIAIFHLAMLFHDNNICCFLDFVLKIMIYHEQYLLSASVSDDQTFIQNFEISNLNVITNISAIKNYKTRQHPFDLDDLSFQIL